MYLSEGIEAYLMACRAENKSPMTMRAYQDALAEFLKCVGDKEASALVPGDITLHMTQVSQKEGKCGKQFSSHSTMKHYAVIRSFVRWMYLQRFIKERVTDYTHPPKLSDNLPITLTDKQVEELYENALSYRNRVIFELFLDTGLRLAEVANLNLDDLHLEEGWCRVLGKGSKEAIVPIGRKMTRDLYIYIHEYRKAPPDVEALFVTDEGGALSREGLAILVRRHMGHLGIEGKHGPHVLRHTFATNFLRNGGSLEVLRRILRHNNIEVTQRYIHLVTEDVIAGLNEASPLNRSRR